MIRPYNTLALKRFALLLFGAFVIFPSRSEAQTTLLGAFKACENSVIDGSDAALRSIGKLIDEDERGSRIRLDTPHGTVVAMFIPPSRQVRACVLWGRDPQLAAEFATQWQDWVEWPEARNASQQWFRSAMGVRGSVDLTDNRQPGYVVARCDVLEHGLILASQPALANAWQQILPEPQTTQKPTIIFQFSAIGALPGRCKAAVNSR